MVSRKTSLPYPTSPPPPPPPDFGPPRPNHDIDSSDLPPIPTIIPRETAASPYGDVGNPWDEEPHDQQARARPRLPDILKPANGRMMSPDKTAAQEIPDVMKPGWSGENTPRSSIDSQRSRDFWESSDDEKEEKKAKKRSEQNTLGSPTEKNTLPSSLQIKRKPITTSSIQAQTALDTTPAFASTNPFRRAAPGLDHGPSNEAEAWARDYKGKGKEVGPPKAPPAAELAELHLGGPVPDLSAYNSRHVRNDDPQWDNVPNNIPPIPHVAPPPIPDQAPPAIPEVSSPFSSQPPLIPVSPAAEDGLNPWTAQPSISSQPSPIPFKPSQKQNSEYASDLLDRGQHINRVSLEDELKVLPNHAPALSSQMSLLDDKEPVADNIEHSHPTEDHETYLPPPGPPPSHLRSQNLGNGYTFSEELPPVKPPRPAVVTSMPIEADLAQMQEQRNETYQIKHFNWYDQRLGKMRSSSMLTQNKNGPCPLLALVNALILGANDQDQAALDEFLRTREQVTLGTIIENLMVELLSAAPQGQLPDVDELNRFLLKLRTGMNMNPRFVPPPAPVPNLMDARNSMLHLPNQQQPRDQPGSFESTQDIRLYGAFGVRTVHGWLPEPGSDPAAAFARSAQSYEDAQAKLFGEDELEYKLSNDGLTPQEQVIWEDIISIKNFLNSFQSQLTPYGLECIKSNLQSGSFAILFRNDHFSTIYKHPRTGRLYTLVTDAGYYDRDEIVWESLVDISGQQSAFYSGDFNRVSQESSSRRQSDQQNVGASNEAPLSPQERQEQSDLDYAMALQMQLEEEDDQRRRRAQSQSQPQATNTSARTSGGRRSSGNIPITLNSNASRPPIPARNQRSHITAVNRPVDQDDPDAPPAYEEAARTKAYNPPLGSPLHPQSSATPETSPFNSSSQVNITDTLSSSSGPSRPLGHNRRMSAYAESQNRLGSRPNQGSGSFEMGMSPAYEMTDGRMPGTYIHTGHGGHGQSMNMTGRPPGGRMVASDRDRDCIVM